MLVVPMRGASLTSKERAELKKQIREAEQWAHDAHRLVNTKRRRDELQSELRKTSHEYDVSKYERHAAVRRARLHLRETTNVEKVRQRTSELSHSGLDISHLPEFSRQLREASSKKTLESPRSESGHSRLSGASDDEVGEDAPLDEVFDSVMRNEQRRRGQSIEINHLQSEIILLAQLDEEAVQEKLAENEEATQASKEEAEKINKMLERVNKEIGSSSKLGRNLKKKLENLEKLLSARNRFGCWICNGMQESDSDENEETGIEKKVAYAQKQNAKLRARAKELNVDISLETLMEAWNKKRHSNKTSSSYSSIIKSVLSSSSKSKERRVWFKDATQDTILEDESESPISRSKQASKIVESGDGISTKKSTEAQKLTSALKDTGQSLPEPCSSDRRVQFTSEPDILKMTVLETPTGCSDENFRPVRGRLATPHISISEEESMHRVQKRHSIDHPGQEDHHIITTTPSKSSPSQGPNKVIFNLVRTEDIEPSFSVPREKEGGRDEAHFPVRPVRNRIATPYISQQLISNHIGASAIPTLTSSEADATGRPSPAVSFSDVVDVQTRWVEKSTTSSSSSSSSSSSKSRSHPNMGMRSTRHRVATPMFTAEAMEALDRAEEERGKGNEKKRAGGALEVKSEQAGEKVVHFNDKVVVETNERDAPSSSSRGFRPVRSRLATPFLSLQCLHDVDINLSTGETSSSSSSWHKIEFPPPSPSQHSPNVTFSNEVYVDQKVTGVRVELSGTGTSMVGSHSSSSPPLPNYRPTRNRLATPFFSLDPVRSGEGEAAGDALSSPGHGGSGGTPVEKVPWINEAQNIILKPSKNVGGDNNNVVLKATTTTTTTTTTTRSVRNRINTPYLRDIHLDMVENPSEEAGGGGSIAHVPSSKDRSSKPLGSGEVSFNPLVSEQSSSAHQASGTKIRSVRHRMATPYIFHEAITQHGHVDDDDDDDAHHAGTMKTTSSTSKNITFGDHVDGIEANVYSSTPTIHAPSAAAAHPGLPPVFKRTRERIATPHFTPDILDEVRVGIDWVNVNEEEEEEEEEEVGTRSSSSFRKKHRWGDKDGTTTVRGGTVVDNKREVSFDETIETVTSSVGDRLNEDEDNAKLGVRPTKERLATPFVDLKSVGMQEMLRDHAQATHTSLPPGGREGGEVYFEDVVDVRLQLPQAQATRERPSPGRPRDVRSRMPTPFVHGDLVDRLDRDKPVVKFEDLVEAAEGHKCMTPAGGGKETALALEGDGSSSSFQTPPPVIRRVRDRVATPFFQMDVLAMSGVLGESTAANASTREDKESTAAKKESVEKKVNFSEETDVERVEVAAAGPPGSGGGNPLKSHKSRLPTPFSTHETIQFLDPTSASPKTPTLMSEQEEELTPTTDTALVDRRPSTKPKRMEREVCFNPAADIHHQASHIPSSKTPRPVHARLQTPFVSQECIGVMQDETSHHGGILPSAGSQDGAKKEDTHSKEVAHEAPLRKKYGVGKEKNSTKGETTSSTKGVAPHTVEFDDVVDVQSRVLPGEGGHATRSVRDRLATPFISLNEANTLSFDSALTDGKERSLLGFSDDIEVEHRSIEPGHTMEKRARTHIATPFFADDTRAIIERAAPTTSSTSGCIQKPQERQRTTAFVYETDFEREKSPRGVKWDPSVEVNTGRGKEVKEEDTSSSLAAQARKHAKKGGGGFPSPFHGAGGPHQKQDMGLSSDFEGNASAGDERASVSVTSRKVVEFNREVIASPREVDPNAPEQLEKCRERTDTPWATPFRKTVSPETGALISKDWESKHSRRGTLSTIADSMEVSTNYNSALSTAFDCSTSVFTSGDNMTVPLFPGPSSEQRSTPAHSARAPAPAPPPAHSEQRSPRIDMRDRLCTPFANVKIKADDLSLLERTGAVQHTPSVQFQDDPCVVEIENDFFFPTSGHHGAADESRLLYHTYSHSPTSTPSGNSPQAIERRRSAALEPSARVEYRHGLMSSMEHRRSMNAETLAEYERKADMMVDKKLFQSLRQATVQRMADYAANTTTNSETGTSRLPSIMRDDISSASGLVGLPTFSSTLLDIRDHIYDMKAPHETERWWRGENDDDEDEAGSSPSSTSALPMARHPDLGLFSRLVEDYELTEDDRACIAHSLQSLPFCEGMDMAELNACTDAMTMYRFGPGEVVCLEGDESGTHFFITRSGELTIFQGNRPVSRITNRGTTFGESVLFLNGIRKATVKAVGHVTLFGIEGLHFRDVIKYMYIAKVAELCQIIEKESILSRLPEREKDIFCEKASLEPFVDGDCIVDATDPDESRKLYFPLDGTIVMNQGKPSRKGTIATTYFGETSILVGQHSHSAVALTSGTVVSITKQIAQEVFGRSLDHVMARNLVLKSLESSVFSKFTPQTREHIFQEMNIISFSGKKQVDLAHDVRFLVVLLGELEIGFGECIVGAGEFYGDEFVLSPEKTFASGAPIRKATPIVACGVLRSPSLKKIFRFDCVYDSLVYDEKLAVLKKTYLFATLSVKLLDQLTQSLKGVTRNHGEHLAKQGFMGESFFIVRKGTVALKRDGRTIQVLEKGDYFGECSVLYEEKLTASLVVESDSCSIWELDRKTFRSIMRGRPQELLEDRVRQKNVQMELSDLSSLRVIGKGAFGVVKMVQNVKSGNRYALKVLNKQEITRNNQIDAITSERAILAEIDHPFVARFLRSFRDDANVYFLLELVTGGELLKALGTIGILSQIPTRFYIGCLVLALEYLHSKRIIYRDVKSENIILDRYGYVKLIDFGAAKKLYTVRTHTLIGTPQFMAPEVIKGKGYGLMADAWSLGICMYEFMCGELPFGHDKTEQWDVWQEILHNPLSFPKWFKNASAKSLIQSLLRKNPSERAGSSTSKPLTFDAGTLDRGSVLGFQRIKEFPFFENFDWDALLERSLPPPLACEMESFGDFEDEEPVVSTASRTSRRISGAAPIRTSKRLSGGPIRRVSTGVTRRESWHHVPSADWDQHF